MISYNVFKYLFYHVWYHIVWYHIWCHKYDIILWYQVLIIFYMISYIWISYTVIFSLSVEIINRFHCIISCFDSMHYITSYTTSRPWFHVLHAPQAAHPLTQLIWPPNSIIELTPSTLSALAAPRRLDRPAPPSRTTLNVPAPTVVATPSRRCLTVRAAPFSARLSCRVATEVYPEPLSLSELNSFSALS